MIQPGNYDITIQQGASFSQAFQFKDSNGDPIDLTGYTVASEIWSSGKHKKYADFTASWVDRSQGSFIISMTAAKTFDIPSSGYWDILVTNPDGSSDYWVRGEAILEVGYTE